MANRYWVNGGSGLWNNTNNWSATSGGPSGASVPTSADDVFFDNLGNSNSTVNAAITVRSITCGVGYTSNLAVNNILVVLNGLQLSIGMTTSGSSRIQLQSGNLRSNGVNINSLEFCSIVTPTFTLLDNCAIGGLIFTPQGGIITINGFAIDVGGTISQNGFNQSMAVKGTTVLNINGTGNQSFLGMNSPLGLVTNINKASGTFTIGDWFLSTGCILTYVTGTVVCTGTLQITGNVTLNTSGISWLNLRFANSGTSNLTFTSAFTLTGQLSFTNTVVSIITFIGAGFFTSCGSIAYNSQNITTVNLVNDLTTGNFSVSGGASVKTLNGGSIFINGNLTMSATITGNATLIMSGTGTWSGAAGSLAIDLVFNTAGTITVSGIVTFGGSNKTMTYTAGTMITTGGILRLGTNCSLNLSGMIWDSIITYTSNPVYTLTSNLRANSFATTVNGSVTFNGNIFYLNSLNLIQTTTTNINGTTQFILDGTGTITGGFTTGSIRVPLVINTLGTITFSGSIHIESTFIYIQGTINPDASTFKISGELQSNNTGLNFYILRFDANITNTGTHGWATQILDSATGTHTYKAGNTYVINNLLQLLGTAAARITMLSDTPGSRANFILASSATQTVGYVTATDIDSSGGDRVWDWQGALSNTLNWNVLTANIKEAYTFIN